MNKLSFYDFANASRVYKRSPEKSYERLFNHLQEILPSVEGESIARLLK